jgi:dihydrofolate reductase
MIRFMAAIDQKRGIADDHGIPWHGKLPTDIQYYHEKIKGFDTIMGYGMYIELSKPLVNPMNYVASQHGTQLRDGFVLVEDAHKFIEDFPKDIWVLGGAGLFASTIDLADELYLTKIDADFNCTKFFPAYEHDFTLVSQTPPQVENGLTFSFTVYKRNGQK